MSELLLELFSEEIPARMQGAAAGRLERALNDRLLEAGFMPDGVKAFAGPRRLTFVATGLPVRQPDRREEKKGPRVGAPDRAIEGFLKSAGLASLDDCETRADKKGEYYVAVIEQTGRDTAALIAEAVPDIIRGFSWPKSMRWGAGDLRWVRPLHGILCVFDNEIVPLDVEGVAAGDQTRGHRFMAPDAIHARNFEDYEAKLRAAKVLIDADERAEKIAGDAATLCAAQGLALVEDKGLLNEVAGLAEWPVAMLGAFDEKFLILPDEVLTASMRGHQKYFSVHDPKNGALANKFIYVANLEAPDGGAAMRVGYERVLEARLSDGWFLYHQDLKRPLEDRVANLDRVTFFEGLGSIGDKARRVAQLASEIAPAANASPELAERVARLAKADLVTGMVNEFPELQGLMGRYYALEQGETSDVADAIRDHYKPVGQDDDAPSAPLSIAAALADKLDTLAGFWAIDKKPTGSSDPFALRRAALGVIDIIIENKITLPLEPVLMTALSEPLAADEFGDIEEAREKMSALFSEDFDDEGGLRSAWMSGAARQIEEQGVEKVVARMAEVYDSLRGFIHDRLKVYLRDRGHRHDRIEAVLTSADGAPEDDLLLITQKLSALTSFLETDDGGNLAAAYKRAANILKAEEKKDGASARERADEARLEAWEEKSLYDALEAAEGAMGAATSAGNFEQAMTALSELRAPVDAFFEKVTVNDPNPDLRANRLALLARLRAATQKVADFSKLEG